MIRPVSLVTNDVPREVLRVSAQNPDSSEALYLEINSVKTFFKRGDSEFVEMQENDLDKYSSEESLRDETIEYQQEYDILIQSQHENYTFRDMICEVEFDKNETIAYLVIKKGSKLNYTIDLYDEFLDFIMEQKIRNGIMLYLFDVDYEETIKGFVDVIAKIKTITFKEDKKIQISEGIDEIPSIKPKVTMTLEEKSKVGEEDKEGKVDYSNRGFLLSCTEGEELFEFAKPKQGKHGRSCKGKLIEVETVDLDAKPTFTTEDSIEIVDSIENIKYLSTKSGYLVHEGDKYDVSNSIDVDEISFRTTGTINTDLESEITINVVKEDPLEDAIEEGMKIKVQQLYITGSIGRYTKIEARDVSVSGQTHNDSDIKCSKADLNIHKGRVVGRTVEVETLDGGYICADKAIVNHAVSGTIKAKVIEIENLGSRLHLEASELIKIEHLKGEENKFIMDSLLTCGLDNNDTDVNDEEYKNKLEKEIEQLGFKLTTIIEKIKTNHGQCEKIKAAIIKAKDQGIEISSAIIEKFKICRLMKIQYKKVQEDIRHRQDQLDKVNQKIYGKGSNIMDAKIVLAHPLHGFNHISFHLYDPEVKIELGTDQTMSKKVFKLGQDDETGVYRIVNTD